MRGALTGAGGRTKLAETAGRPPFRRDFGRATLASALEGETRTAAGELRTPSGTAEQAITAESSRPVPYAVLCRRGELHMRRILGDVTVAARANIAGRSVRVPTGSLVCRAVHAPVTRGSDSPAGSE